MKTFEIETVQNYYTTTTVVIKAETEKEALKKFDDADYSDEDTHTSGLEGCDSSTYEDEVEIREIKGED